jgi:spore coat protein CotH
MKYLVIYLTMALTLVGCRVYVDKECECQSGSCQEDGSGQQVPDLLVGEAVEVVAGALVINETAPSSPGGEDWFELYAAGTKAVNLGDYSVVDDKEGRTPEPLPSLTLQPGEFVVVYATDEEIDGHAVTFKLGSGDALSLLAGSQVVDTADWNDGDAPSGTTWGRLPDGTGEFKQLEPTPGEPNSELGEPSCVDPFTPDQVVEVQLELSQEAWDAILAEPTAEQFQQGNFVFGDTRIDNVGIRTKGNSSLNSVAQSNSIRFPFKVDFNLYVSGQNFCGMKKVVFNSGFKDPTLMREHLAYKLAREAGMKASRTMFVDLTVGEEHLGLYTMVENVDDDFFLFDNFGNDDGDMYKPELPHGTLEYKGDDFGAYTSIQVENNEDSTDHGALLTMLDVINNGPADQLEQVLDVESALKYIAFDTLFVNLDSYTGNGHNYYLYEQDGVFTIVLWDLNEVFGNFSCGCQRDGLINFVIDEPTCSFPAKKPLAYSLLQVPEFKDQYHQILQVMKDDYFDSGVMSQWITETADLIRPYVQSDTTKFYTNEQFELGLTEDMEPGRGNFGTVVIGLEAFIVERSASIQDQLDGTAPSTNDGKGNCQGGGGPGPNPQKCPDGICDAVEQANPDLCPEDCE